MNRPQVVELLFAIVIFDVLIGLGPDLIEGAPPEFLQQDATPCSKGTEPFDLYSSSTQSRQVAFSKAVDHASTHKLEVRVLGQKNTSSTGTRVDIDAFVPTS